MNARVAQFGCPHAYGCTECTEDRERLRARIATLEAQRDEYAEQYGVMGVALTVAERKLSAYVGVCAGDKELTESVLPKVRGALRGVEGKSAESIAKEAQHADE